MDALTGSYTVTTDPSMINEPPGKLLLSINPIADFHF